MTSDLSLSKPPVVDAIVELRFDSQMPSQVVAGILFDKLTQHGYGSFEELDIAQLPTDIKENDPNLRFAAHYRFKSEHYFVSISSRVIAIVCKCVGESSYQGWDNYIAEINKILQEFDSLGIVSDFSRVGVRFVNLFTNPDILSRINISISAPNSDLMTDERMMGFVYKNEDMSTRINFATKAKLSFAEGESMEGAVLDVDSYIEKESITFEQASSLIEDGHRLTEDAFVSILKEDFMEEFK